MLKIQRFASRSHSARVLGLKLTPIFIIFQYKRIQKASREEKSTLTKWISLQCSFSENRQSLLFPLEEGFKVKAFNVFHLSDTPVLACVSIFAHTHMHIHTEPHMNVSGLWCWILGWWATEAEWVWAITSCVCIIDALSGVQRSSLPHYSSQSKKKQKTQNIALLGIYWMNSHCAAGRWWGISLDDEWVANWLPTNERPARSWILMFLSL